MSRKNIKFIGFGILLILMFIPNIVFANSKYIAVSIGDIKIGSKVLLESESGFDIVDINSGMIKGSVRDISLTGYIKDNSTLDIFNYKNEQIGRISIKEDVFKSREGNPIGVNGKKYRGDILFIFNGPNGKIINDILMDDYLYGVLPREMGASFPREALKAQAIASRSFAISNAGKHLSEGYNLCNTTHCQVYGGVDGENVIINRAIDETRGMTINYNGQVAEGIYHSNNGGFMESGKGAWGGHRDYLIAKEDPYSTNSPNSNWEVNLLSKEITNKLRASGIDIGEVKDINITETSEGKRVKSLEIIGSKGKEKLTGARFRSIIGNDIKSTYFNILKDGVSNTSFNLYGQDGGGQPIRMENNNLYAINSSSINKLDGNGKIEVISASDRKNIGGLPTNKTSSVGEFKIKGYGYGHGVGMSQYGAKTMAEQGYDYKSILLHYYPGVEIY